jgi:hypothetical protein
MEAALRQDGEMGLQVVRRWALRAFDERLRNVRVADIVFDSLLREQPGSLPAGSGIHHRRLRWETASLAVDSVIATAGHQVRLWLRVQPPFPAIIDVRSQRRRVSRIWTDDSGAAGFSGPRGLVSFVVSSAQHPHDPCLQTAWVSI